MDYRHSRKVRRPGLSLLPIEAKTCGSTSAWCRKAWPPNATKERGPAGEASGALSFGILRGESSSARMCSLGMVGGASVARPAPWR